MGFGVVISVWVARYLGPDKFGTLNYAIAFAGLFGALASLGLDGVVVRCIIQYPAEKEKILSSAFILKFTGGISAFLLSLVAAKAVRPADTDSVWLVGIVAAGTIFQSFDIIDLWFQARVKSKYTVLAKNGAFIILAMTKICMILLEAPLIAFAWAVLAELSIGALGLVVFFTRQLPFAALLQPSKQIARKLLRESWPLMLSSLAVVVYMRIDQVMLAQMISDREVGFYSAALRLSEIWYFIPMGIVSSVAPSLTRIRMKSREEYMVRLQQLYDWLLRIAYLLAFLMTFISPHLVIFLYGNDYRRAGTILSIHIWTAIFVFMGVGSSPWTINEGTMKYSLIQTTTGACLNICLNYYIFIPGYGAVGAAIATLLSQFAAAFAMNACFSKLRPLFVIQFRSLINPLYRSL